MMMIVQTYHNGLDSQCDDDDCTDISLHVYGLDSQCDDDDCTDISLHVYGLDSQTLQYDQDTSFNVHTS